MARAGDTLTEQRQKLAEYLDLIEQERDCRPAEAMLADEIVRLRDRAKRLMEANDGNHARAVNAERDVARLRARHNEKNAEAHDKHSLLGLLIDALSDDLAHEVSNTTEVKHIVREALVLMDDDRYRSYLDAWWLQ